MELKQRYEKEDFILVTEQEFSKRYPSDEEKIIMLDFYKKSCIKELSNSLNIDVARVSRLETISQSFLSSLILKEYKTQIADLSFFIQKNKLKKIGKIQASMGENDIGLYFDGALFLTVSKMGLNDIVKKYLHMSVEPLLISLSANEKEGIFQAYLGLKIAEYTNIVKK